MAIIVSSSARSMPFILAITNHVYRRQVVSALKTTAAAARRRHTTFAMLLAFVTLLLVLATRPAQCHQQQSYDVVRNFHAAADGKTDDAKVNAKKNALLLASTSTPSIPAFLLGLVTIVAAKTRRSWRHGRRRAATRPGQSWSSREDGRSC